MRTMIGKQSMVRLTMAMLCLMFLGWAQQGVAAKDISPKVKLTSPANHAVFVAPADITLTATASDKDGTIKRVQFFNGSHRLATIKSAPYTFTWTNVKAGKYTLTAVATDNKGAKTTSNAVHIIVDILPTVSLTSPVNGASFKAPATIPLTASAKDPDGKITKVDFFQGTSLIATVTSKPYTFTLKNVQGGNYSFTAVATDNRGEATTSSPVTITVVPDIPPTISLTANGATFKAPASVMLTASANDVDGTIAKVDFFQGNIPIATITPPAPFIFIVNNLAQGSYTFTAIATDNQGATTTSNQATITVTPATAQVYYIFTDQLNTPRAITDQTNKVVWRWDNQDPFGANVPDEDPDGDGIRFTCNLRFPGQYFDKETNTHYNYFRDYDPATGRYIESDPIGLWGGLNTYTYVINNSVVYVDPNGREVYIGGHIAAEPIGQWTTPPSIHLNILLVPNDVQAFANLPGWIIQPNGQITATLGGQPLGYTLGNPPFGNLRSFPNYTEDVPENSPFRLRIRPPCGMTDTQFINALIRAAGSYRDNLPYTPIPTPASPGYNSNSFVAGVLKAVGVRPPELNLEPIFQAPGYNNPIPLQPVDPNSGCTCR